MDAYTAAHRHAVVVERTGTAVLTLQGRDARRFCNGMFTNNVRDLPVGDGNRHAMVDAKGKVGGLLDLYAVADDRFLVVLDGVSAAEFEERYGKFIVFDDVEVTDLTPGNALLTVQGPASAAILAAAGLPVPERAYAARASVTVVRRDRTRLSGFDVLLPTSARDATLDALTGAGAARGDEADLEVLRVEAGQVRWPIDAPGRALVHELGLRDEVCNFDKGCYIGQEVINRVDVMGQVKKALAGVRLAGDTVPAGDLDVRAGGQVVGRLTSVVRSPALGWIGLAIVRKPHDAPGPVEVVAGDVAVPAEVVPLPFPGRGA